MGEDEDFVRSVRQEQVLLWAIAARRELHHWDRDVAAAASLRLYGKPEPRILTWTAEIDRHFALVALANLVRALRYADVDVAMENKDLPERLTDLRNVNEHWDDYMPTFSAGRKIRGPQTSGGQFAEKYPGASPYQAWSLDTDQGAMLGPDTPVPLVLTFLGQVETAVLAQRPDLVAVIPEPEESPWLGEDAGDWLPRYWPRET